MLIYMFQIIAFIVLVLLTFKNISERSLARTLSAEQIFQEGDIRETSSDILIQYLPENSRLLPPLRSHYLQNVEYIPFIIIL